MSRVNYTDIADRYDNNPIRSDIPRDGMFDLAAGQSWRVLDVGCGTGSYIKSQADWTSGETIEWHGVDPSDKMLEVAKTKVPFAKLYKSGAEHLPFPDGYLDYITSRFSFHHFSDRLAALKEIHRVLKPNGLFKVVNIVPELSPNWWVFRYFPDAKIIDEKRFWTLDRLKSEVLKLGFTFRESQLNLREKIDAKLIVNEARNRETSELILISDEHYRYGLRQLETELCKPGVRQVDWGLMLTELTFIKTLTP